MLLAATVRYFILTAVKDRIALTDTATRPHGQGGMSLPCTFE
jgi:hypothetical protein